MKRAFKSIEDDAQAEGAGDSVEDGNGLRGGYPGMTGSYKAGSRAGAVHGTNLLNGVIPLI